MKVEIKNKSSYKRRNTIMRYLFKMKKGRKDHKI